MLPFLAPILTSLASSGLSVLAGAIQAKGKEVIEDKLGVKIPDSAEQLTPELIQELKIKEMEHEEFLVNAQIELAQLSLDEIKEDNKNTDSAREMNTRIQESANADHIAKVSAYYLDFLIIGATLVLACIIIFKPIPTENKELLYTAFGSLLALCGTIMNFHRGTSSSSKNKDDAINHIIRKG